MTDELAWLDGNAAAGPLSRVFSFEVTNLKVTCPSCGVEPPLGNLYLYGAPMGMFLRCFAWGEVILGVRGVGPSLRLASRGPACLALGPDPRTPRRSNAS